jgi:phosphate starvation-inducible protein PhoH and related proteins
MAKRRINDIKVDVSPKSTNQGKYQQAMGRSDITLCKGLPGTGKTFLAVAKAIKLLQEGKVSKIIITRPLVEAGEKVGYLPGDLDEKAAPYMRPIFDCILKFMTKETFLTLLGSEIEVAPLAYMQGRTFDYTFMMFDEAQNATLDQIEMFLTRMGKNSKVVLSGDPYQVVIEDSGLILTEKALHGLDGFEAVQLEAIDIVRHRLISEVVTRIEMLKQQNRRESRNGRHLPALQLPSLCRDNYS